MQFSIRDALWAMLIAAVATAWGVDHWRLQAQQAREIEAVKIAEVQRVSNEMLRARQDLYRAEMLIGELQTAIRTGGEMPGTLSLQANPSERESRKEERDGS